MKQLNWFYLLIILSSSLYCCQEKSQPITNTIDRKAVVSRHHVKISTIDTLGSLSVGNGKFAFTVDVTGLQSFPEFYQNGVPLGTQSEWGWHTFPNQADYQFTETLKAYNFNENPNRLYAIQDRENIRRNDAADYFRANPHRLQLGNIGLEILKANGSSAGPTDLKQIHQELDLWTGKIESQFSVEGIPVKVTTYADANKDGIAAKVESPLLQEGRIKLKFRFPYPTNAFSDRGTNYEHSDLHQTKANIIEEQTVVFHRKLDNDNYVVKAKLNVDSQITEVQPHYYMILPKASDCFEVAVEFAPETPKTSMSFKDVENHSIIAWESFWQSGAAVDFSACTDPRAFEIERRVVLSQYLTRLQCAGHYPIQETGLTYNSWYGKPHMEMYWWHSAHYPLWGRTALLEQSIGWYFDAFDKAKLIAERQGYKGVRWQKMTDHNADEAPSNVGSFLIWQQPHVIYLAELIYRNNPSQEQLEKFKTLIFSTADFMASFAHYDAENDRYILGQGIIPAQECFNKTETYNSPFELAYWKWALEKAQQWRSRLGMPKDQAWQQVIDKLSPMAQKEGVYLAAESVLDSYSPSSKHTIDHPAVLGALSILPSNNYVNMEIMNNTFNTVDAVWHWDHTWGWDFPLEAMTATRLNRPEDAIKALLRDEITNTYLPNGHNYQTPRLTLYLPGNGGLLSAIALMCAGYDGCSTKNPGFPKNGKWDVKWEGLQPMP
ncbi:hypothetical protein [Aestuariibaculum sediminum]|uniref:Glycoside hydrolase family 65 n=1 Tax=Aestuariibaculum sediminum TaxID=2770637 RepID=A0A8J6Q0P1_9FLAO|nr:hypothetical protein [Aestuariibaculum sediminum]MBD0832597.1 hypothetical protein [Aestuariibaculum sediminum]